MKSSLQFKLGQRLNLSPQLRQAIDLLLLPALELQQKIQTVLECNPLLELDEESSEILESFENENLHDPNFYYNNRPTTSNQFDTKTAKTASPHTLKDHLLWQMQLTSLTEKDKAIATIIIDSINEDAYLENSLEEIHLSLQNDRELKNVDLAEIQTVLNHIQQFEPLSVDARNLGESQKTEYIVPDVIVRNKNKQLVVKLYMDLIPKLKINSNYAYLTMGAGAQDTQYLSNQFKEARWFLKCLERRHEMLLKISSCIVDQQLMFFEEGEKSLKPLNLQDIADKVELHKSSVSRILANKYIDTPKGLFALKYFLGNAVETTSGGKYTAKAIQAIIKQMITEEKATKPFSDHRIVGLLLEKGIKITRRTVTKYREVMGIPSSLERKRS